MPEVNKREIILTVAFLTGLVVLMLATERGRGALSGSAALPWVELPRWVVWSGALALYAASRCIPVRLPRIALGFVALHAFIPLAGQDHPGCLFAREAFLLALVVLLDLHGLPLRRAECGAGRVLAFRGRG